MSSMGQLCWSRQRDGGWTMTGHHSPTVSVPTSAPMVSPHTWASSLCNVQTDVHRYTDGGLMAVPVEAYCRVAATSRVGVVHSPTEAQAAVIWRETSATPNRRCL